jgi:hypothetical protein
MRFPGNIAALAITAAWAGCSFPRAAPQTYEATVERIEDRPGDFFSPLSGRKPFEVITLDVSKPAAGGQAEKVRVLVLDIYKQATYGKVGDRVAFQFPGSLPEDREMDFDTLSDYRVVPGEP